MTPSHAEGLAAAKRVNAANDSGEIAAFGDVASMLTYHLSLMLRTVPERARMRAALGICRQLISNTRESLD